MTALPGLPAPAEPAVALDGPLLALAVEATLRQDDRPGAETDALVAAFRALPPRSNSSAPRPSDVAPGNRRSRRGDA